MLAAFGGQPSQPERTEVGEQRRHPQAAPQSEKVMDCLVERMKSLEQQMEQLRAERVRAEAGGRRWRLFSLVLCVVTAALFPLQTGQAAGSGASPSLVRRVQFLEDVIIGPDRSNPIFSRTGTDLFVRGVNLYIQNGSGSTLLSRPDGKPVGNLIIGYNEVFDRTASDRAGYHNLVIGPGHAYPAFGGLVTGYHNAVTGNYASVIGGSDNRATGEHSAIAGGLHNLASARHASVTAGLQNSATADGASVSGGTYNNATGRFSSVSGGTSNESQGENSSISGGRENITQGFIASVSGGRFNWAMSENSTVSGGYQTFANATNQWAAGESYSGHVVTRVDVLRTPR